MKPIVSWSNDEYQAFGAQPIRSQHTLADNTLFHQEALLDLLDHYPRKRLQAFTMGTDPLRCEEWEPVEVGSLSGGDLLAAVERGRLWLNILRLENFSREYADVVNGIYDEIKHHRSDLDVLSTSGTLLISSPTAQVYFHTDATPNMLFHIRGRKRIWLYPAQDTRFISQELMEKIFASAMDEEIPYSVEFDDYAVVFDLSPGESVAWPHNAPHRIQNVEGVNVSLSTNHKSEATERRKEIYLANRLLRRKIRLPVRSTVETGAIAYSKRFVLRAHRRLGLLGQRPAFSYVARRQIDPDAENMLRPLDAPMKSSFSD